MSDLKARIASTVQRVRKSPRYLRLLLAVGLVALVGVFATWRLWPRAAPADDGTDRESEDPRLTFATPYRNVRPEVRYVGQEACTSCHEREARTYRDHPMGRSLAPVASATSVERYDATAKNPFEALGFAYQIDRRDGRVIHRETAAGPDGREVVKAEAEVQYAVGSGTRGRTYLIDHDGYLFQSPIAWYAEKGAWNLSPGYDRLQHHFGRPVQADCLFCHSNRALEVADTQNHYRPPVFEGHAIGCERCHGPGELHVRRQESDPVGGGLDDTIVNPRRLEPVLREAVCEQCHLQGVTRVLRRGRQAFDFRPGLPLHLFLATFVKPPAEADREKFVGQVEQMHASRCFRASEGRMGCISCHDPHVSPAAEVRVAYYRDRCQSCHADRGCSLPLATRRQTSKDDNCVQCHMPKGESDIQHHSITDHRIPRRPGEPSPAVANPMEEDDLPLRLFHRQLMDAKDPEADRDVGVALMDRVERYAPPVRGALGRMALPRLRTAVRAHPADVSAWDAAAHALWAVGDADGAAADFDEALARAPRREITLQWAAALALERRRPDAAVGYMGRALEVNPWRHEFHFLLAEAQARRGDWAAAYRACQESLRLNPAGTGPRKLLVEYHLAAGRSEQARAELDRLLSLHPPDAEALRRWFDQRVR